MKVKKVKAMKAPSLPQAPRLSFAKARPVVRGPYKPSWKQAGKGAGYKAAPLPKFPKIKITSSN